MRTIRTVAELRAALTEPRRAGRSIGLVPTMGALHEGHVALLRRARADTDVVVMSLFVNPTQFNEAADLAAYPRDEARDAAAAAAAGVDVLFAPPVEEIYPAGFATTVSISGVTEALEGQQRGRSHFDGVATVVAKLFNIVDPAVAYFGQKDAQQVAVIRRLVADLDFPVTIEVVPTVRAADGLALSSRNVLLSATDRERATALPRALGAIWQVVADGETDPAAAVAAGRAELAEAGIEPEYLEVVSPETMQTVEVIAGPALAVVAARVGGVRLIDNAPIGAAVPTHNMAVATPAGASTS